MGRIFETRKSTMFARWDRMSKQFTRVGKDIVIAVKAGGPDADSNPALRRCLQNAKSVNMPKDRVDAAIKRAMGKDMADYHEVVYEGYAPHGVALMVESATDNPTRTIANIRMHFDKGNGNIATTGSVSFQFQKMGVFKLKPDGLDKEELELDLIDFGLEEMGESTGEDGAEVLVIRCAFHDFGAMQKALEEKGITPELAEAEWIPTTPVELPDGPAEEVLRLVDRLEQDEDVQKVFHNLA